MLTPHYKFEQWEKTSDLWHTFAKSNAEMDVVLNPGAKNYHYRLEGLVRESDVAELVKLFDPWFQKSSTEGKLAKSFHQNTELGEVMFNFYQGGQKQQSSYTKLTYATNSGNPT